MKQFNFLMIALLLFYSCSDDSVKIREVTSEKYEVCKKEGKIVLHVKASNAAGKFSITFPGTTTKITETNDKMEAILNDYMKDFDLRGIEFFSDCVFRIFYGDKIFPDQITDDGFLEKSLQMERRYDKMGFQLTEKLANAIDCPYFGKLPSGYDLRYKTTEDGRLVIYLDHKALNLYWVNYSSMLHLTDQEVKDVKDFIAQFSKVDDVLELGIYFNKVK